MQIATGAMSTLLPKLGKLLMEEYKLQKSVWGEIMFLKAELEHMEAALLKVSEAPIDQPPDIQVKLWAKDVKDLSYEIEDSIDKFMVRIDVHAPKKLHNLRGFIDRSLNLLTKAKLRHKIGTEVKDIKSRIKEVAERRDRYKVDNVVAKPIGPSVDSLCLSALYKKVSDLVGTKERSDDIVKAMMEGDEVSKKQLKVVSIVGFGGLGKTTVAKVVYEKLKVQFDCGAFVSVSLNPNMVKIFKNMLHQLGKYSSIDDEAQLIHELREFLGNKRYFIVIDDIWDKPTWEKIKWALIENEYGSRVITTTRILDVAKQAGGVYQLKPLSPADSRKLFYQRMDDTEDKCPLNELAKVSEKILKKCGGVPLAIITIASMLASKKGNENTHTYWYKVYQSIGSGLGDGLDVKNMRRVLSISYYDLPPHLKACLLYLSLYPEDDEIWVHDLIFKWVGDGFIEKEKGKSLREVGEDYLYELINKSLIQPVYTDDNYLWFIRLHDMVLDLITCLSSEENFLTTLGGQQPMTLPNKIRRLSLQTSKEEDVKQLSTMSLSHVRSILVHEESFGLLPPLLNFPVLRVLDLTFCKQVDNHHCKDICNLLHLRDLSICWTSITEIPDEIGNLQFLQVLDISDNEIEHLPSTFVQLRQLVYLRLDKRTRLPDGFGNLKSLLELRSICIWSPTMLHDLGGLTDLRALIISFVEGDESYKEPFLLCLSNLVSLQTLHIDGWRGGVESQYDKLSLVPPQQLRRISMWPSSVFCAVPNWMSSLSSLSSLCVNLETLAEEDLRVLGSIPSLNHLTIKVKKQTQDRDERLVIDNGFPFWCLTHLIFKAPTMEVVFAQGAMQKVQALKLRFAVPQTEDQFGDFDFGLENLSSLKEVCVDMVSGNSEHVNLDAAVDAIQKALDTNPNNPTLSYT